MPSSTSSSSQRLPALRWAPLLVGALVMAVLFVTILELRLAWRGFRATVVDSESLWLEQRARAGALGQDALILVGASRIQLDADLDVLRARTGLEPVQLAIDGTSFVPVLEGLAADPAITGTVLVDFADHVLVSGDEADVARRWQADFERLRRRPAIPDFDSVERRLSRAWRHRLRSYGDGAQPLTTVRARVLERRAVPQYLVTLPDRSRLADYSKVPMPAFYYRRVIRALNEDVPVPPGTTPAGLDRALRERIDALTPLTGSLEAYAAASRRLAAQAAAIRARGGRVFFLMLPKSGLVRAIDERRFPRALFWDRFAAIAASPTLHFADVPSWQALECPDGSHLDFRQRADFTRTLVEALGLERAGGR